MGYISIVERLRRLRAKLSAERDGYEPAPVRRLAQKESVVILEAGAAPAPATAPRASAPTTEVRVQQTLALPPPSKARRHALVGVRVAVDDVRAWEIGKGMTFSQWTGEGVITMTKYDAIRITGPTKEAWVWPEDFSKLLFLGADRTN